MNAVTFCWFFIWIFLIDYLLRFQEILFYEDGEPKIDGVPGDLKVATFLFSTYYVKERSAWHQLFLTNSIDEQIKIRTARHERYRRDGNDLHTTVEISLVLFTSNLFPR
jgi:DnaJ homolog subfamily B member 11